MIEHVVRAANDSSAKAVYVATDNADVVSAVEGFGGTAVMTDPDHQSGSDRIAEACEKLGIGNDEIVVNVQGDEPQMPPVLIDQVAALLARSDDTAMATLCTPLVSAEELLDPAVVKVVTDSCGRALYFSRAPIPWVRGERDSALDASGFSAGRRHLGIYAYRSGYIRAFSARGPCELENKERLEQLRALWHGDRIGCEIARVVPPAGVDNAEDLARVRTQLDASD